jgi:hypothetical protein
MSQLVPVNSARRTVSIAAAALFDVDGIKTSFATSITPVTVVPADLNGGGASITTGYLAPLPRIVTISRSSVANQYSVAPIVLTYKRGALTTTQSVTPANDDGNDTLVFTEPVDAIVSIAIPAQAAIGGAFTIGYRDICAPAADRFTAVKLHADGTINCQYGPATGSPTDAVPALAHHIEPISPTRILTSAALAVPTTVGLTVYLP